jgi:hypothetical protein
MHLPGIAGEKTDAEGTDLIYEGITTCVVSASVVNSLSLQVEGTDLIYEGITTGCLPYADTHKLKEGTDLIYEGITTGAAIFCWVFVSSSNREGTDLIYEGITTHGVFLSFVMLLFRRN